MNREIDDHKFCIIMCVNDREAMEEASYYINRLIIPEGYELEFLSVEDAVSMTSGYNEAMNSSNAKYKIYTHQDVFFINRNILSDLLRIFKDKDVGLIGMVGIPKLPENGVMLWNHSRLGALYCNNNYETWRSFFGTINGEFVEVEAIDGFFIASQYDIPWREDIFTGWDFYDVSQSFEFHKAGYKVVVPRQEDPWCFHDDGFLNLDNYYYYRRVLKDSYPEFFEGVERT